LYNACCDFGMVLGAVILLHAFACILWACSAKKSAKKRRRFIRRRSSRGPKKRVNPDQAYLPSDPAWEPSPPPSPPAFSPPPVAWEDAAWALAEKDALPDVDDDEDLEPKKPVKPRAQIRIQTRRALIGEARDGDAQEPARRFVGLPEYLHWPNPEVATVLLFLTSLVHASAGVLAFGLDFGSRTETACALGVISAAGLFVLVETGRIAAFYFEHGRQMWHKAKRITKSSEADDALLMVLSERLLLPAVLRLRGSFRAPEKELIEPDRTLRAVRCSIRHWCSHKLGGDRLAALNVWISSGSGGISGVCFVLLRTVSQVSVAAVVGLTLSMGLTTGPGSDVSQLSVIVVCALQLAIGLYSLLFGATQDRLEGVVVGAEGLLSGVSVLLTHVAFRRLEETSSDTAVRVLVAALLCPLCLIAYDVIAVPIASAGGRGYTRSGWCGAAAAILWLPFSLVGTFVSGSIDALCGCCEDDDEDDLEAAIAPAPEDEAPVELEPAPPVGTFWHDLVKWDEDVQAFTPNNPIVFEAKTYVMAVRVQTAWRRVQARRAVQDKRIVYHEARRIQTAWRRYHFICARAQAAKDHREAAVALRFALRLQALVRRRSATRRILKLMEEGKMADHETTAARRIQRAWWRYKHPLLARAEYKPPWRRTRPPTMPRRLARPASMPSLARDGIQASR